jgi:5-oxoprolinase (ATP-hydrolysing)
MLFWRSCGFLYIVTCAGSWLISSQGGQHACAIAKGLGIQTVIIPAFSSILSAYGIACAEVVAEARELVVGRVGDESLRQPIAEKVAVLKENVCQELEEQGVDLASSRLEVSFG